MKKQKIKLSLGERITVYAAGTVVAILGATCLAMLFYAIYNFIIYL